ncbi:hypothetical protein N0B31_03590 [Salinirubellus salinus]|uniref:DUF4239 domain-containing protein n=1 Tax=Salinirubellus salinus TaxID=1364945 RepID=A0A9E7R4F7_9EURY|nr:hypothetical protein [Salinirubellus salinus]UWM55372.1 hypothetical protein N0B31_03590 [Salinirubellus salinus]
MSEEPADEMRERSQRSSAALYLLLDADRRLLAAAILGFVFAGVVVCSLGFPDAAAALRTGDPLETSFQAFIGATVTGVTIVLTLNQLVLSQELGAVGDQRERMEGAMAFRDDVRDLLGETPPAEPSAFLRAMVDATADRARAVRDTVTDPSDELARLLDSTEENADTVTDRLEGTTFGEFDVVRTALDFNYSWKLYTARRQLDEGDCDDETTDALESLADALSLFGPAREHFKTLYFQSELIDLSRTVLYAAIPSLVITVSVLLFVDIGDYTGTLLGVDQGVLLVAAASAVAVAPFAVLLSYVLRIATVTGRTLSIGPFILRETDRDTDQ